MKKEINVVAAVIVNDNDEILIAQRPPGKSLEYMWEFPGGKVELYEDEKVALKREILEEMDTEIEVFDKITTTRHEYDFGIVILTTYYSKVVKGDLKLKEHIEKRWLKREELGNILLAPADIPAARMIQGG